MATQSYKDLLRQRVTIEAAIRSHEVQTLRKTFAASTDPEAHYGHFEVKAFKELEAELAKVHRDYDKIDENIDFIKFRLGILPDAE